jgi:hypothetical protein
MQIGEILQEKITRLEQENFKKDKIIDDMAEELRWYNGMGQCDTFCYDICGDEEGLVICDKQNCKEHIKEYYYKKVGNKNEIK